MTRHVFARSLATSTCLLVLAIGGASASAAVIVEYDIAESRGDRAELAWSQAAIAAEPITFSGVRPWNPSWGYRGLTIASRWSRDEEIDPGRYAEFAVAVDDGSAVRYETISFSLLRGDYGRGRHGAETWSLHASGDGFDSEDLELLTMDLSEAGSDEQVLFEDLDISDLGLRGGTVTFRLYGADETRSSDYSGLANTDRYGITGTGSNLLIGGSVESLPTGQPVPEPASAVLLLLAAGGLARRRGALSARG